MSSDPKSDEIEIRSAVESIACNADLRRWDAVALAFDARVELDYGVPEMLTPEQVVARWRPLLSAFHSTHHLLRDVRVEISGDTATATGAFVATHTLDGDAWTLRGRYEWGLRRSGVGWRVTRMKMIPEASTGNPTLLDRAKAKAASAATPIDGRAAARGSARPESAD